MKLNELKTGSLFTLFDGDGQMFMLIRPFNTVSMAWIRDNGIIPYDGDPNIKGVPEFPLGSTSNPTVEFYVDSQGRVFRTSGEREVNVWS